VTGPASVAVDVHYDVEEGLAAAWDEPRVGELVRAILTTEGSAPRGALTVGLHLVGDETIRELNAAHLGRDTPTDVLSFPLLGTGADSDSDFVLPPDAAVHLGDVVVSHPRAVAQATDFGHSVEREIGYLVAHGVLHVLGYDHEAPADQQRMRQREEEVLRPLGFTR
jgi:probable rRNA maturation factor